MGELQWALLIVCVVLVGALYAYSRRDKSNDADDATEDALLRGREDTGDQLDLLAPRQPTQGFDEYGVGRPRRRGEPSFGNATPTQAPAQAPAPSVATLLKPSAAPAAAPAPEPGPGNTRSRPVALIVAPTEETDILGPQLHEALRAQGLRFGQNQIYHRLIGGHSVYSVASLLKPGKLDPAEAEGFSTKGLLVLMSLPGPVNPTIAFDDLLTTTRALAADLKAEIFDASRQRVDNEVAVSLRNDIQGWAKAHQLG